MTDRQIANRAIKKLLENRESVKEYDAITKAVDIVSDRYGGKASAYIWRAYLDPRRHKYRFGVRMDMYLSSYAADKYTKLFLLSIAKELSN